MGFSIQITPYLADFWWPCSLHSVSLKAPWHARNKELIAALLPRHLEGSRGPRAYVMALTGPKDSTVTVTEPAGRLDAVVKRQARKTQAAQTPGHLWTDACRSHAGAYANTQRRHAWPSAAHAKWNGIILFLLRCMTGTHKCTHILYKTHTHTQPSESFGSPWQLCPELPIRLRELQTPSAITLSCWLHLHNIIEKTTGALSLKVKM